MSAAQKGFFSFEAERRGASEVISLDFDSECIKRFKICAEALGSEVTHPQVYSVYELDPSVMGTFDLVMFFGLLYHLEHPLLGIEKVAAMTSGTLLIQSWTLETTALADQPLARFQVHGLMSGPKDRSASMIRLCIGNRTQRALEACWNTLDSPILNTWEDLGRKRVKES